VILTIRGRNLANERKRIKIPYQVKNLHPDPDEGLDVEIELQLDKKKRVIEIIL
jgi:hypothetical protein